MVFASHTKEDIRLDTIRNRICHQAGIKLDTCNKTAENIFYSLRNNSQIFYFPDQTQNAMIYVAVVIVFYAAIIFILVGTNIRRRPLHQHQQKMKNKAQLIAILNNKNVTKMVTTKSRDKLNDEQLILL